MLLASILLKFSNISEYLQKCPWPFRLFSEIRTHFAPKWLRHLFRRRVPLQPANHRRLSIYLNRPMDFQIIFRIDYRQWQKQVYQNHGQCASITALATIPNISRVSEPFRITMLKIRFDPTLPLPQSTTIYATIYHRLVGSREGYCLAINPQLLPRCQIHTQQLIVIRDGIAMEGCWSNHRSFDHEEKSYTIPSENETEKN